MNVQELIDELNKITDKTAQVVIFDDHQLNAIDLIDAWYWDDENGNTWCSRVDLNIGEDVT